LILCSLQGRKYGQDWDYTAFFRLKGASFLDFRMANFVNLSIKNEPFARETAHAT
jgi:hypothetical protein